MLTNNGRCVFCCLLHRQQPKHFFRLLQSNVTNRKVETALSYLAAATTHKDWSNPEMPGKPTTLFACARNIVILQRVRRKRKPLFCCIIRLASGQTKPKRLSYPRSRRPANATARTSRQSHLANLCRCAPGSTPIRRTAMRGPGAGCSPGSCLPRWRCP